MPDFPYLILHHSDDVEVVKDYIDSLVEFYEEELKRLSKKEDSAWEEYKKAQNLKTGCLAKLSTLRQLNNYVDSDELPFT